MVGGYCSSTRGLGRGCRLGRCRHGHCDAAAGWTSEHRRI